MARARIRGDTAKLRAWAEALRDAPDTLKDISANAAEEVIELIREGFEKEQDPYGRPWEPLKAREGKILQDEGRLRNSFHRVRSSARGFTVASGADYGGFHQSGTRTIPQRRMVPSGGRLPPAWSRAIETIATDVISRHFKSVSAGRSFLSSKIAGIKRGYSALAIIKRAFRAVQGGENG